MNMLLILLFVMTRLSSMTFYSILTTFQHFFTIFLVLLKFSQSSGYHLNYPSAIFLKSRVEFVGHDLTASGNCPAQSKFNLIQDWPLPTHGTVLLSFIGLCSFYSRYSPWFETGIKPLRRLQHLFNHAELPIIAWSPSTISFFIDCKTNIVSSPLLLCCDNSKPVFLKTDWSANGIRYILMQPDNYS